MNTNFQTYLDGIADEEMREKMRDMLTFCIETYPALEQRIAWNQPMLIDHGTYIIGFSVAKHHLVVGLELNTINHFKEMIQAEGLEAKKMTFQIKRKQAIPYQLLKNIIDQTIILKKDVQSFWF
jgi:uncharacterized protein